MHEYVRKMERMRMEIGSGRIWPDRMGTERCSYHVCEEHIRGRVSPRLCASSIAAFYVIMESIIIK